MATAQVTGLVSTAYITPKNYYSVYIKRNWGDAWIRVPYIRPLRSEETVAPSIMSAEFAWSYGSCKHYDQTGFTVYTPLVIHDWYIAIDVHTPWGTWPAWIGIVQSMTAQAPAYNSRNGVATGEQAFGAVGLETLLMRSRLFGSYVVDGSGFTKRTLTFNRRNERGISDSGNKGPGLYFTQTGTNVWTNLDIAEYALYYYVPADGPSFYILGATSALAQIREAWDFENQSVFDILNALIDRRRGLGMRIITNGVGPIGVYVFSILSDPISFSEYTLPANTWQDDADFSDLTDTVPEYQISRAHVVDTIVARGGRLKVCLSVSVQNSTLEKGWTSSEETSYGSASDEERNTDKYKRVYSMLRVPRAWDWSYTSLDDAGSYLALPTINDDGTLDDTTGGYYFNRDHAFLPTTLLEEITGTTNTEPEYRPMFVVTRIDPGGANDHYAFVHDMQADEFRDHHVRPADREMGIWCEGGINHLRGLNHFAGTSDFDAEIDYEEFIATVAIETDEVLQVIARAPGGGSGIGKELVIEVPDAEMWYVAPGTVSDVTSGALVFFSGTNIIRDDSARLRAAVIAAYAWYMQPRNILSYTHANVAPFHPPGMMIRSARLVGWAVDAVGTVVTSRVFDYAGTSMTVRTGYGELDFGVSA